MSIRKLDRVVIEDLKIDASIGVFDWEKQIKQTLLFDIFLDTDFSQAAQTDDIEDALDYVSVCEIIEETVHAQHYQLLEKLADHISSKLMNRFSAQRLEMTIRKPGAVPQARSVGVSIVREK